MSGKKPTESIFYLKILCTRVRFFPWWKALERVKWKSKGMRTTLQCKGWSKNKNNDALNGPGCFCYSGNA